MTKTPEQDKGCVASQMAEEYAFLDKIVAKWGTAEQLNQLRGIYKHEDQIWPEGYVQLWIPNDFNHYAVCMGYKGSDENGNRVLVAGFRNPFGHSVCVHLPGDEYKYWCELPSLSAEMKKLKEQVIETGAPSHYKYPDESDKK